MQPSRLNHILREDELETVSLEKASKAGSNNSEHANLESLKVGKSTCHVKNERAS